MNINKIMQFVAIIYILIVLTFVIFSKLSTPEPISPCPPEGCEVINWDEMVTPTPTPTPESTRTVLTGLASYYSIDGCLGCREDRIMANSEKLDDSKLTVAFNRAPLNSFIKITNIKTGAQVTAKVTDRGGFERHGKIVDLSVATKNALGCGDVCKVEVEI